MRAVRRCGDHPFVLVRLAGETAAAKRFVACLTQNDARPFVDALGRLPQLGASKLVRGIERALQLEIYEAAELLFSWIQSRADGLRETIYVGKLQKLKSNVFHGYPAYELTAGVPMDSPDDRLSDLEAAFHAYATTSGNDALRFTLMEALALALARALGVRARHERARQIVDAALSCAAGSIHLKAARQALSLKIAHLPVPPRLEKFVGEDNGYLRQFICPQPFERFDIGPDGNVMVCCGHWLPTSIGNFIDEPTDEVLNSPRAQKIRASVLDGSYKYCNHLECALMVNDAIPRREAVPQHRVGAAIANDDMRVAAIEQAMFAFDRTCNLSCPSCRTHVITEKASQSLAKARAVEEKLLPLLPSLKLLHINPAGELFASKPSRKLLELINDETCPDLRLAIISNGTLFSEEEWNKFPGIHNKVHSIRISIDAATKETFEKLRRLGKFDAFCQNMRFVSSLRRRGVISQLKFSFTYQVDNFREMPAFLDFCAEMAADFAIFERLQNIAFTREEFREKAVHDPDHPLHAEFMTVISNPMFRADTVLHDFDFDHAEVAVPAE